MRDERTRWYHCRACGEERLTPESERCPNCGIRAPVTLCHECRLPIRDNEPWLIRVRPNDSPNEPTSLLFHEHCYEAGKRKALKEFRLPDWRTELDSRDAREPISSSRRAIGYGTLAACAVIVYELIKDAPPPQPVLDADGWRVLARSSDTGGQWIGQSGSKSPVTLLLEIVILSFGIYAGLWLIWRKIRQLNYIRPSRFGGADPPVLTDDDDRA